MARAAGVSTATVSRALSGTGYVAQDKREQVLAAAEALGYQPRSEAAPAFTSFSRDMIGMVVPDLTNPFFAETVRGAQESLERWGSRLLVCDSREDSAREIALLHLLHRQKVGGILIAPALEAIDYNIEYLAGLAARGMPIVLLDRDLRGADFDGVFVDDRRTARAAVELLLQHGHRNIALLAGVESSRTGAARRRGYENALRDAGIQPRPEYVLPGNFEMARAHDAMREFLPAHPEVTAVFSSNNLMTVGCLQAVLGRGMRVPEDLALVSFDDMPLFETFGFGITAVSRPTEQMGAEAAAILIEQLERGRATRTRASKRIILRSGLTLRGSERLPGPQGSAPDPASF